MALARGDIVLVPFPFTDFTARKVRPALIVSPDPQGIDVVVVFISSVAEGPLAPTEWRLPASQVGFEGTGLKTTSVFKCSKLLTLHRSLIQRRLGQVSASIQHEIDQRLRRAVGVI